MKAILVAVASIMVLSGTAMAKDDNRPDGRFQIINAGDASGSVHIYLLDTHTGRTWVTCSRSDVPRIHWCAVADADTGRVLVPPLTTR